MRLKDVIEDIEKNGGRILKKDINSTGECKDCENAKWELLSSQDIGEEKCEWYMCMNTNGCDIISRAYFIIKYDN